MATNTYQSLSETTSVNVNQILCTSVSLLATSWILWLTIALSSSEPRPVLPGEHGGWLCRSRPRPGWGAPCRSLHQVGDSVFLSPCLWTLISLCCRIGLQHRLFTSSQLVSRSARTDAQGRILLGKIPPGFSAVYIQDVRYSLPPPKVTWPGHVHAAAGKGLQLSLPYPQLSNTKFNREIATLFEVGNTSLDQHSTLNIPTVPHRSQQRTAPPSTT